MENKSALIVVDTQVEVLNNTWNAENVIANINKIVEKARDGKKDMEVIWVQHNDSELLKDSAGWQLCPPLKTKDNEKIIHKNYNSAFEKTSLDDHLKSRGIKNLYICGAATNWCIRATTFAAVERGYFVTVLEDAHTTVDVKFEDGLKLEAKVIVTDFNMNALYLDYAEKKMDAMTTADFIKG